MRTVALLWLAGLLALLAGCSSAAPSDPPDPDPAACKAAMVGQFATALADPSASPAARPRACDGLSDAQVQAIAAQILSGDTQ